jgi:hypothetical protein
MSKSCLITIIIVAFCVSAAESCYAAPGVYTGWCSMNKGIVGSRGHYVKYCFDVGGDMSLHCEVMASNYPRKGEGHWGSYDVGVINDGECAGMYWGPVSATPSVRCWSYGLPVTFNAHIE